MTKSKTGNIDRLQDVLERFGADAERWPQEERAVLEELLRSQADARALFDEFKSLDQLLDQHGIDTERALSRHDALSASILKAVAEETTHADARDNVVPFQPVPVKPVAGSRAHHRLQLPNVAAAGALAASLMLGIALGATGSVDQTWTPVSEALGLSGLGSDMAALSDPVFDAVDAHTFEDDLL